MRQPICADIIKYRLHSQAVAMNLPQNRTLSDTEEKSNVIKIFPNGRWIKQMDSIKEFWNNVVHVADLFKRKTKTMGMVLGLFNPELSEFQKRKLLHEFRTFFDLSKDGTLEWKDFDLARQKICEMSGWKPGSDKYLQTHELFKEIWRKLQDDCDENFDGKITEEEWLKMWETFNREYLKETLKSKDAQETGQKLPSWLEKYIEYKFNLLDRTGNGFVDAEEYEYVMSDFGVPPKDAKNAFLMFSKNNEIKVDMKYFKELCTEYYRSDNPSDLGNFINGKLDFKDD